jgi:hypothetical protein
MTDSTNDDRRKTVVNGTQSPSTVGALRRRRRFSRGLAGTSPDRAAAQTLNDTRAELVLLREENARLSAAAHEPPSLGRLITHARKVVAGQGGDDHADEAAQLVVEAVVLRESLLEVCRELERSMAAVKSRLTGIGEEAESLVLLRSTHDDPAIADPGLRGIPGGPARGA